MATVTDTKIVMSVDQIRRTLAERIKEARKLDTERQRVHKQAEKEWLADAKTKLRDLAKLDYDELCEAATKAYDDRLSITLDKRPECPTLAAPWLERWQERFKLDERDTVHVDTTGDLQRALTWRPDGYSTDGCK